MPINGNNMRNAMQMANMFRNGNPQEIVTNMVKEMASQGNPVMKNLADMIATGDTRGIENIVKNVAKERGIDFDKEFNSFRQMFRL